MVESLISTLLHGSAGITDIVGQHIHHVLRPENETGAAIVFQRISTVPVTSLDGESGLDSVRMQIKCFGATHLEAFQIADEIRDAVKASTTIKGVPVMLIADLDEKTGEKIAIIDFNVWERR